MQDLARTRLLRDAGLGLGVLAVSGVFAYPSATGLAVAAAMSAPLALRRLYPRVALAVLTAAAAIHVVVLAAPSVSAVAVPMLIHALARWSRTADARAGLAVGLVGALVGPARWLTNRLEEPTAAGWATTIVAYAGTVIAAYVSGRRGREREEREAQRALEAAERQRLELAERERTLRAAAAEERIAVSREVHDIVAHSLSVIAVQAEGGRAAAMKHPERAPEILGVIAEASRGALDDLRELVAMLRGSGQAAASEGYRPAPGLGDLDELVARLGGRARLHIDGDRAHAGPVVGLTVYRTVQESLTNVLRHAGPAATVEVRLEIGENTIAVAVTDDGNGTAASATGDGRNLVCVNGGDGGVARVNGGDGGVKGAWRRDCGVREGAAASGHGGGTGLAAMRERILLHGGVLTAGPRTGGGFAVRAELPVHRPASGPAG
jgi:signal transduction histidine kinase